MQIETIFETDKIDALRQSQNVEDMSAKLVAQRDIEYPGETEIGEKYAKKGFLGCNVFSGCMEHSSIFAI